MEKRKLSFNFIARLVFILLVAYMSCIWLVGTYQAGNCTLWMHFLDSESWETIKAQELQVSEIHGWYFVNNGEKMWQVHSLASTNELTAALDEQIGE